MHYRSEKFFTVSICCLALFSNAARAASDDWYYAGQSDVVVPGSGIVKFVPKLKNEGLAWLKSAGFNPRAVVSAGIPTTRIDLSAGDENKEIATIRKQEWALLASREPDDAGPGTVGVTFKKDVHSGSGDFDRVASLLSDALIQSFPNAGFTDTDITRYRKGLSYDLKIEKPAGQLLGSEYKGYWIKTDIHMFFTSQKDENGKYIQELDIDIPDGYMAKWPKEDPPPDGHFDHLDESAGSKYKDFTSLIALQISLADKIASKLGGERFSP